MHWSACHVYGKLWHNNSMNSIVCVFRHIWIVPILCTSWFYILGFFSISFLFLSFLSHTFLLTFHLLYRCKWREKKAGFIIAHRSRQGWFNQLLLHLSILKAPKTFQNMLTSNSHKWLDTFWHIGQLYCISLSLPWVLCVSLAVCVGSLPYIIQLWMSPP